MWLNPTTQSCTKGSFQNTFKPPSIKKPHKLNSKTNKSHTKHLIPTKRTTPFKFYSELRTLFCQYNWLNRVKKLSKELRFCKKKLFWTEDFLSTSYLRTNLLHTRNFELQLYLILNQLCRVSPVLLLIIYVSRRNGDRG